MNGRDAFQRIARQLEAASRQSGGGGGHGAPRGAFAGAGLLIALIGGGVALNSSLFNGE
jgi:prohibitin 2